MSVLEKFSDMGLSDFILEALTEKGFEKPTEIQQKVIPLMMNSQKNILGQSQTGSGKTAAFGIPLIEHLNRQEKGTDLQAVVLAPTRELAMQISKELNSFIGKRRMSVLPLYGGQSMQDQIMRIRQGVNIIVATPGRLLDHLKRKTLQFEAVEYVILDEADEMLNMGFIDDIDSILSFIKTEPQFLMFSATVPRTLTGIINKYMKQYEHIVVETPAMTNDNVTQSYFEVDYNRRLDLLARIVDSEEEFYGIVFCSTKVEVDRVASGLMQRNFRAESLHGDCSQSQREKSLARYRSKGANILVATDVASRGIDIQNVTHVINYGLPQSAEAYIHRIGRTGRAGKKGQAITFITRDEQRKIQFIRRFTNGAIDLYDLPSAEKVFEDKYTRVKDKIVAVMEAEKHKAYFEKAEALLEAHEPASIVAGLLHALLEQYRKKQEGSESYSTQKSSRMPGRKQGGFREGGRQGGFREGGRQGGFREGGRQGGFREGGRRDGFQGRENSYRNNGLTELFLSQGSEAGADQAEIAQNIRERAKLGGNDTLTVKVLSYCSFINVDEGSVDKVLNAFKGQTNHEGKTLLRLAHKKNR